jgi:pimeloyl-ACP methyl ester carboxylesterase
MKLLLVSVIAALCLCQSALGQSNNIQEDMRLTTTELLIKYGYPAEIHTVTTDDGYILELHRCPGSPLSPPRAGKPVAFVMHGMLSSSADFVIMGPQTSLAYMLADLGYDVWMGNARGNRYSRTHTRWNPSFATYWQFTWHEIGTQDLPTSIDYVLRNTGQQRLHYIGHSQGTTAFWVMASERPAYNDRIISMQALAPAAYMHNTRSPYVIGLSMWLTTTTIALQMMGQHSFAPTNEMNIIGGYLRCRDGAITQSMCSNELFLLAGYNSEELNTTMLPVINAHSPAGASTMQMIHYGQITRSRIFRQYDHGIYLNPWYYGSIFPPRYNLSRVTARVAFYHSTNDWLATPEDVAILRNDLPNVVLNYLVPLPAFNHLDFVWAINVRRLLYNRMVEHMRQMETS